MKLTHVWCRETAHPSYQEHWTEENPAYGQCVVSALLVNDEFPDALIYKCKVGRQTHYYNMFTDKDKVIDLTREQFGNVQINYEEGELVARAQLLKCKHVKERYILLKQRLQKLN